MFLILWEFEVKSGCEESFQSAYHAHGEWAQLFCRDPQFVETRLFRDFSSPNKFLTVDVWESRSAYESFQQFNRDAYSAIDENCERLTIREQHLGDFENAGAENKPGF
jgi:heme-degrading monooxygenase HmoA